MLQKLNWSKFQAVSLVSFHPELSNTEFLKQIVDKSENVKSFEFLEKELHSLDLSGSEFRVASLQGQLAEIQNKYYNAKLYFIALDKNIPLESIPEGYFHGTVVYFDNNNRESFDFAKSYVVESNIFLEDSSVKLFVCDTAREFDLISRIEIQKLCIDNGFELVELEPEIEEENEDDLEDDFKETLSYERIFQSLEANVWPHLEFVAECSRAKFQNAENIIQNNDLNEQNVEEFENLLSQFKDFKDKAANMDGDTRKEYAEKVAMMFFNSVCDDDEKESEN